MALDVPRVAAAIPIKDLHNAKQRLSPILTPAERRGLFEAMVEDVLDAVAGAQHVAEVFVVTCDAQAKRWAGERGISILEEPQNRGHTAAVSFAARSLIERGESTMLTLPADIPLARSAEFDDLILAHRPGPSVTIAPARDEMGSNAVLCSPPDALPFRFGENSFFPHLEKARAKGIEPQVVSMTGIGLDVDTPEDLRLFCSQASDTRAFRFVECAGINTRCFSAD